MLEGHEIMLGRVRRGSTARRCHRFFPASPYTAPVVYTVVWTGETQTNGKDTGAVMQAFTDDMLKEIALLESVGFDKTNFARFVGHKVSITGQLVDSTQPPTLRVSNYDNIKIVADICAPGDAK